jgi:hypothetical protein
LFATHFSPFHLSFCLSPVISVGLPTFPGWTHLPCLPLNSSMKRRRHFGAGCWKTLKVDEPLFRCHFCDSGFVMKGCRFKPCLARYHPGCLRMGAPFTTRLDNDKGLLCPDAFALYRGFICENCRVRPVLGWELQRTPVDTALLMLERATLIDTFNHWSEGTIKVYKSKLNVIQDFERDFPIHVLPRPTFTAPPLSASRPLMWAQERYSLYPTRWK